MLHRTDGPVPPAPGDEPRRPMSERADLADTDPGSATDPPPRPQPTARPAARGPTSHAGVP